MQLTDLLTVERIGCDVQAASKKRAIEKLSTLIAAGNEQVSEAVVFDSLLARERLGSTGLGRGVAIPHGRVKDSERAIGAFMRLEQSIDFDAVDKQPVDLLFALLVPEHATDEHLQLLAQLAEMFSNGELVERLRQAKDADALFDEIRRWQASH